MSEEMKKYLEESYALEQEIRAIEGDELYEANEHWVNNPLISPISKVDMFDKAIERAKKEECDRILSLFEDFIAKQKTHMEDVDFMYKVGFEEEIDSAEYWIARIKGETK